MKFLKKTTTIILTLIIASSVVAKKTKLNKRFYKKKKGISKLKYNGRKRNRIAGNNITDALRIKKSDLQRKPKALLFARTNNSRPVLQVRFIREIKKRMNNRDYKYDLYNVEAFKNGRIQMVGTIELSKTSLASEMKNRLTRERGRLYPREGYTVRTNLDWNVVVNGRHKKISAKVQGDSRGEMTSFRAHDRYNIEDREKMIYINRDQTQILKYPLNIDVAVGPSIAYIYSGSQAPLKRFAPIIYFCFGEQYIPYPAGN